MIVILQWNNCYTNICKVKNSQICQVPKTCYKLNEHVLRMIRTVKLHMWNGMTVISPSNQFNRRLCASSGFLSSCEDKGCMKGINWQQWWCRSPFHNIVMGEGHDIGAFVVLSPTLPLVNQSNVSAMTNKRAFDFYLSRILGWGFQSDLGCVFLLVCWDRVSHNLVVVDFHLCTLCTQVPKHQVFVQTWQGDTHKQGLTVNWLLLTSIFAHFGVKIIGPRLNLI